jgi:hypothetical protein
MMAIVLARKGKALVAQKQEAATIDRPSHIHTGTPVQRANRIVGIRSSSGKPSTIIKVD